MATPKILAFAGSSRGASLNKLLLAVAADGARAAGAEVTQIDLRDYPMPIYDGDDEMQSGVPDNALVLRGLIAEHDALLVATPEYNGSVTALLKNALDWCSRPINGEDGLLPYRGKMVALLAASMSPFGGIRAVTHTRGIFNKMGAIVLPDEVLLPQAQHAFDAGGNLLNETARQLARQLGAALAAKAGRGGS
ncbi:MAG: NADPH-dependent FMN reductase [Pigmentiphaga sp.]|uniref:NADPH-dependent FMN reductase n=1 Tax=Pigmentiphaga sp. TaxID=1977564 RepID=UPI003B53B811